MSAISAFASKIHKNSTSAVSAPNSVVELLSSRQQWRLRDFLLRKDLLAIQDSEIVAMVEPLLDNANVDSPDWKLTFPALANVSKKDATKLVSSLYELPVVGFSAVAVSHVDSADIEADAMVAHAEKLATARDLKAEITSALAQFDAINAAIVSADAALLPNSIVGPMKAQLVEAGQLLAELRAAQKASMTTATIPPVPTTSETIVTPAMGVHESATQPGIRFEIYTTQTGQTRVKLV